MQRRSRPGRWKQPKVKLENLFFLFIKISTILVLFYGLSKYKPLIVILVFEVLDFLKNILKQSMPYLPIDLVFVFGVTAAYYYNPFISLIIFFLGVLNRIVMLHLEIRHITKCLRHFTLFLLIPLFKGYGFFFVAFSALTLNYMAKYLFNIARGSMGDFDKFPFHVVNFVVASLIFYFISMIYFYFPFLS